MLSPHEPTRRHGGTSLKRIRSADGTGGRAPRPCPAVWRGQLCVALAPGSPSSSGHVASWPPESRTGGAGRAGSDVWPALETGSLRVSSVKMKVPGVRWPWFLVAGVLIKRGNLDTDMHRGTWMPTRQQRPK